MPERLPESGRAGSRPAGGPPPPGGVGCGSDVRADIQSVLDAWSTLHRGEYRRLARLEPVQRIESLAGSETVVWFQSVEWSAPLFAPNPTLRSEPDAGVLALTPTRLILIGRDPAMWPLSSVETFVFRPANFGDGTPAHFSVRTSLGLQNLVLGRRVSQQPMLSHVRTALASASGPIAAPAGTPVSRRFGGADEDEQRLDAIIGELATLRDRGTITQAQFEEERLRLLG